MLVGTYSPLYFNGMYYLLNYCMKYYYKVNSIKLNLQYYIIHFMVLWMACFKTIIIAFNIDQMQQILLYFIVNRVIRHIVFNINL